MKAGVCFKETDGIYVPRAILVDLDPTSLDDIKNSGFGSLYNPDNFIQGEAGAGNNYAKAHYEQGPAIIDTFMDAARKEIEASDCFEGF